jgi:hypothetical protein
VGRETLRTGGKILTDIAKNNSPDISARDIVSKHVTESTQTLIRKLLGRGRKRVGDATRTKIKNLSLQKGTTFPKTPIHRSAMAADTTPISTGLDIFASKPVQTFVLEMTEVAYKPLESVDQSDLEFLISSDGDTYIDLNFKLFIRAKLIKENGTDLDPSDLTAVTNNFLHSLFIQCSVTLNDTTITQAVELYHYRLYLETILTYDSDTTVSHLKNAFCYLDDGDILLTDPLTSVAGNKEFIKRCVHVIQNKKVRIYGRIHSDICNVTQSIFSAVRLQIKLIKSKSSFYMLNKDAGATTRFKFLDVHLLVNHARKNPTYLLAHNTAVSKVHSKM